MTDEPRKPAPLPGKMLAHRITKPVPRVVHAPKPGPDPKVQPFTASGKRAK
jgi:hypothetical protein